MVPVSNDSLTHFGTLAAMRKFCNATKGARKTCLCTENILANATFTELVIIEIHNVTDHSGTVVMETVLHLCKRDLTERCLLRVFVALESLYPTALLKKGPMKWFVRHRGAGFYHMIASLDALSRGVWYHNKLVI